MSTIVTKAKIYSEALNVMKEQIEVLRAIRPGFRSDRLSALNWILDLIETNQPTRAELRRQTIREALDEGLKPNNEAYQYNTQ